MANILGIDFGAKRVGLALATTGARPQRLTTVANDSELWQELGSHIANQVIGTIVVGLPRNLDGNDTPQTEVVRQFVDRLRMTYPQAEVVLQDEALTSEVARERLERSKEQLVEALLDQEAAVIILEDYLRGPN